MYVLLGITTATVLLASGMWRWGRKARSYKGQHVVVIGGSTGIGLAIAKQFAARGANITLIARRQANLQTAAAELEELVREKLVEGGEVHPKINICSMDITETEQVESGFEALPADLGPIDVLVCSAGMAIPGLFNEQTFDVFSEIYEFELPGQPGSCQTGLARHDQTQAWTHCAGQLSPCGLWFCGICILCSYEVGLERSCRLLKERVEGQRGGGQHRLPSRH
eukprot:jgi/Botrbrau1/10501/Bobra.0133s0101.1